MAVFSPSGGLHLYVDHSSTWLIPPNHGSPRKRGSQVPRWKSSRGMLMSYGTRGHVKWLLLSLVYEDHQVRKAWAVSALSDICIRAKNPSGSGDRGLSSPADLIWKEEAPWLNVQKICELVKSCS
jgi:hypothetical protein